MSTIDELNVKLANAFGIDVKDRRITGFTLEVKAFELPKLTVCYDIRDEENGIVNKIKELNLVAVENKSSGA